MDSLAFQFDSAMISVVISLLWTHTHVLYVCHWVNRSTYVPFVVDIGETLQYLFAEREESKHDFVSEYVRMMYVSVLRIYIYLYIHFIAAVLCVDMTIWILLCRLCGILLDLIQKLWNSSTFQG